MRNGTSPSLAVLIFLILLENQRGIYLLALSQIGPSVFSSFFVNYLLSPTSHSYFRFVCLHYSPHLCIYMNEHEELKNEFRKNLKIKPTVNHSDL